MKVEKKLSLRLHYNNSISTYISYIETTYLNLNPKPLTYLLNLLNDIPGLVHTEHVPEFLLVRNGKLLCKSNSLLLDEQKV